MPDYLPHDFFSVCQTHIAYLSPRFDCFSTVRLASTLSNALSDAIRQPNLADPDWPCHSTLLRATTLRHAFLWTLQWRRDASKVESKVMLRVAGPWIVVRPCGVR